MPIETKDVLKAMLKSRKRKPQKEKKVAVKRKEFVKNEGRYFAPLKDVSKEKITSIEKDLKKSKGRTKLQRFYDNIAISKSSSLDFRLGTYYEFENGVSMSIVTTEGTEVSSLTLQIDVTEEDIRMEKVPGLYHLMIQILLSDKFIELERGWNPLEPGSFREYIREIGGKINIQYMPSCIMISVGCSSKDYIKMLEYFFDALYLNKNGVKRKFVLKKSSIKEAVINMNINYFEQIQDETYLRFEILRDIINKDRSKVHKTTNKKSIDLLSLWSFGSENTVHNLIQEGNIEEEILTAHERMIEKKIVTAAFHSNLSHKKLFSILNDYEIPFLKERNELEEKKGIISKIKFRIGSRGEITDDLQKKKEAKNEFDNEIEFKASTSTVLDFKSSIVINSELLNGSSTNGELELQWVIPAFYSSLSSTKAKPLKIISHLFESGSLAEFLKKRRIVDSINSGEVYFAAHSSHKLGFTIFSLILKLSNNIKNELDPKSEIIQFIVQSVFAYIYSLIEQVDLSLKDGNRESKDNDLLFKVVEDIIQIENYISNSNYQMNSEKDDYIDFFDRNFEVTETIVQNIKSHNPSEILVGNNRFYSKINVILKYIKHTLENALKPTNFMLYLTSPAFFGNNYNHVELNIKIQNIPPIKYSNIKFEKIFLDLLSDKINLKKYVIKMDPLIGLVKKYNLVREYDFLPTPFSLLKNSKLTFIDGNFEWSTFSSYSEPENPIEGTTPFISNPVLISDDSERRFSVYYSKITYPNMTNEVYQSSLSSGIVRWYDNFDYSKLLREKKVGINLHRNSFLASFISRILFAVWVTTTLTTIFKSYKRIGATVNFQPCHYYGTALPINCLQLYLTSPSPMFQEYITETLNSVRSVSMVNINDEIALKAKLDTINELKRAISGNSLSNNCNDKIKKVLLPEFFTLEEALGELNKLNNKEVSLLLNKKLFIQNPYIKITGLISHTDDLTTGIEIIKESLVLNHCFNNIENIISDIFYDNEYKVNTQANSILQSFKDSNKKRVLFKINNNKDYSKDDNDNDKSEFESKFQHSYSLSASSLWISVPEYDTKSKAIVIVMSRLIQYVFKHIYLPTTLLVSKRSIKDINLVVIPSPFVGYFGIHFIVEYLNNDLFTSEDATPTVLLLDFLSFIKDSSNSNNETQDNSNNKRSSLLSSSLPLIYRQMRTEVILQLLLSQTQIVTQSSHLFGRITELLESGKTPTPEEIEEITHEKETINEIIRGMDPDTIVKYLKSIIENSSMIIVESGPQTVNQNIGLYEELSNKFEIEEIKN
ncbi:hypothetical protein FG386_003420 [Cryptosporidium ryanae]|uniref:uncharacterized protein n=1 Tax=Cryptosporidium ryanae TaxID=515981 RepID=UPI003519E43A|nr:hypothetical protein FG386_003420 [Cryptosporidium ryanae]